MAEEKKQDKKHSAKGGEESGGEPNLFIDTIFWVLLILVAFATVKGFAGAMNISFGFLPSVTEIFSVIFNTVQIFSVFLSLLFFIGIIYFNFRLGEITNHQHGGHGHTASGHAHTHVATSSHSSNSSHGHTPNKRWQNVLTRLDSFNEGDWRLSIIEADILLNDMLSHMGYQGESIADKLKQAEKSDFNTLDLAWEAHKIRNRIAHDGASFHLTQTEAKRIINLFKKVFEEFYFI